MFDATGHLLVANSGSRLRAPIGLIQGKHVLPRRTKRYVLRAPIASNLLVAWSYPPVRAAPSTCSHSDVQDVLDTDGGGCGSTLHNIMIQVVNVLRKVRVA